MGKETKSTRRSTKDGEKTRRTKKDSPGPKRGLSAYMFFSQDQRNAVKEQNPDVSFGQLGKLLGQKWREMGDEEKKPYVLKAEADKKRYEEEKAAQS